MGVLVHVNTAEMMLLIDMVWNDRANKATIYLVQACCIRQGIPCHQNSFSNKSKPATIDHCDEMPTSDERPL